MPRMGILQVFDNFYEIDAEKTKPQPGDIYWVPTADISEVPTILDVTRSTPEEHEVTSFEVKQIENYHFTERERLPIHRLNLGNTEELLISKAKKRPVVVLATTFTDDINTLPKGAQQKLAGHLSKPSYLVAPMYSTTTMLDPGTFGPQLVARIRALQYLHFFCLPDEDNATRPGSIVRLDRVFPTYLGRGCNAYGKKLHPEPFEVLLSQFSILSGVGYSEPYELIKELVQDALPDEE